MAREERLAIIYSVELNTVMFYRDRAARQQKSLSLKDNEYDRNQHVGKTVIWLVLMFAKRSVVVDCYRGLAFPVGHFFCHKILFVE